MEVKGGCSLGSWRWPRKKMEPGIRLTPSVSKKSFRHAVRILKLSKKVSKSCLIERAVGFLPPAHTPRCSVPDIFCEVF